MQLIMMMIVVLLKAVIWKMWLNDTTVDGFLGNLRESRKLLLRWIANGMQVRCDASKPPSERKVEHIVEDPVGLLNIMNMDS